LSRLKPLGFKQKKELDIPKLARDTAPQEWDTTGRRGTEGRPIPISARTAISASGKKMSIEIEL
jgi:hypothetical protein